MTRAEKREHIKQLIADNPERSDREIGRVAGVDGKTVAAVRKLAAEIPHSAGGAEIRSAEISQRNSALRKLKTPQPAENGAAEIPQLELDRIPIAELVTIINAWPQERRAELIRALRRPAPRLRPLPAAGARKGEWKFKTGPDQRAGIIAAAAVGMRICAIAERFGVKRQTVTSIINAGR